jgi:hypothetical protein
VRPGVHLLLVEPRVLFGWAVRSQHRDLGARRKAQRSPTSMGRFATGSYRPSVTENQPTAGSRREAGGVSLQPPRLLQD